MMMTTMSAAALTAGVVLVMAAALGATVARAHPAYQAQVPNGDRVHRNGVHWPGVGHLAAAGGGNAENAFGAAFAAAGHTWTTALCNADTDGDGFSNGYELGDPSCAWTAGGAVPPERSADITHPGFADSAPLVTTPSYRLVGPSATEGVLQGRIHPRPWGAVNFGGADRVSSPAWAHEYCRQTAALDPARRARAWVMADRPAADEQHLPGAPYHQYVSISDVTACVTAADMRSCSFTYSDVGSPQNSTAAAAASIYVDCRDNEAWGVEPSSYPVRLRGTAVGRGVLEVYHKSAAGQPTAGWLEADVVGAGNGQAQRFVCGTLLGYDAAAFTPLLVTNPAAPSAKQARFEYYNPAVTPEVAPVNSTVVLGPSTDLSSKEYLCAAEPAEPTPAGPAAPQVNATVAIGHTATSFAALVAAAFPGVAASDVDVLAWQDVPTERVSRVALRVQDTVAAPANPSAVALAVAAADPPGSSPFGTIVSRVVYVGDTGAGWPAGVPELWIDGPDPHRGVLKARYGGDPWGHVAWAATNAAALCTAAGQLSASHVPAVTALAAGDAALWAAHAVAGEYVAISGGGGCSDAADLATCRWVYSPPPPAVQRNVSAAGEALWLDCQASSYPEVRLLWSTPGIGVVQARKAGDALWQTAWTDMAAEKVCRLAGMPDYEYPQTQNFAHSFNRPVSIFLHDCDVSDTSSCTVTTHEPPVTYTTKTVKCAEATLTSPHLLPGPSASTGEYVLSRWFTLRWNVSEQDIIDWVTVERGHQFNVSAGDMYVKKYYENATTGIANFEVYALNDNPGYEVSWRIVNIQSDKVRFGVPDANGAIVRVDKGFPRQSPRPPPTAPDMRLNGPTPDEGFPEARYSPSQPWGKFHQSGDANSWTNERAHVYCKGAGRFDPNYLPRLMFRTSATGNFAHLSFGHRPDVANHYEPAMHGFVRFGCSPSDTDDWANKCSWWYNEKPHNYDTSSSAYAKCDEKPWPLRLAGAFPGIGVPYAFVDVQGWKVFNVATDPAFVCERFFGVPTVASHTPTATTVTGVSAIFSVNDCGLRLPDAGDKRWWLCPFHLRPLGSAKSIDCMPGPSTVPFGGASVTQLNAAIDFGVVSRDEFRAVAAFHAGVADPGLVLVHQWRHVPEPGNMTYVTVTINDTAVNANVALAALAANASAVPWLATDVRAVPVPVVGPASWAWGFEARDAARPFVVNAVTRPTTHYQNGVPCAARWTAALSATFCATVFGVGVLTWPRPPTFVVEVLPLGGVRHMVVEEVLCAGGATDLTTCSYAYAEAPTAACPGDANVVVDCQPPTPTATFSATRTTTASATGSAGTATLSLSVPPTATRERTPTASHPVVVTGTRTAAASASVSGGTGSVSRSAAGTASPPPTASVAVTASARATRTPDVATPAPPTPAPPPLTASATRSAVPPTRSASATQPPPPPSLRAFAALEDIAPVGLRPGQAVPVRVGALATSRMPADGALTVTVALQAPLELAMCGGAALPPQCTLAPAAATVVNGSDTQVECTLPALAPGTPPAATRWSAVLWVAAAVPYAPGTHGRGAAAVRATARSGALPANTASATVGLRVVSAWPIEVTRAEPAMNLLVAGGTLTLHGRGLEALPRRVWVGPFALGFAVAAGGRTASAQLPAALPPLAGSSSDADADGCLSEWNATQAWRAAARSGTTRNSSNATVVLRRFGADWLTGSTFERPPEAPHPNGTVAAREERATARVEAAQGRTVVEVYVPTCGRVSPGTTATLGDSPSVVGTLVSQRPVATESTATNSSNATAAATACRGSWLSFAFPAAALERGSTYNASAAALPGDGSGHVAATRLTAEVTRTLTVTVADPEALTATVDRRRVVLPALAVDVAVAGPNATARGQDRFRANVSVAMRLGTWALNVTLLAYPDRATAAEEDSAGAAHRAYPVELQAADNDATSSSCSYDARNVSAGCARGELQRPAVWRTAVRVAAPAYYRGGASAVVHVGAADAPGLAFTVRFGALDGDGETAGAATVTVASPPPQPHDDNNGPTGNGTAAAHATAGPGGSNNATPLPPTTTSAAADGPPVVGLDATPGPAALGAAMARGIFGAGAACAGTHVSFVAASLLVGAALVLARVAAAAVARRSRPATGDAPLPAVSPARALVATHAVLGALAPCRPACGPAHAAALVTHVFVVFAVAAALVNHQGSLAASGSVAALAALGGTAGFVAVAVQAVVSVPFRMYGVVDERRTGLHGYGAGDERGGYAPSDLAKAQVPRSAFVGVTDATLGALAGVDFAATPPVPPSRFTTDHDDDDIGSPSLASSAFDDVFFGIDPDDDNSSSIGGTDEDDTGRKPSPPRAEDASSPPARAQLEPHPESSSTEDRLGTTTTTPRSTLEDDKRRDPHLAASTARRHDCIAVDSRTHAAAGFVAAAALTLVLALYTAAASAGWCAGELATFWRVVAAAAALDVTAGQALYTGGALAWAWLNTDDDGDDGDSESESDVNARGGDENASSRRAASLPLPRLEPHPVHGELRFVGLLDAPSAITA